jgi:RimJ/RimL family protein N-acetyltransferase
MSVTLRPIELDDLALLPGGSSEFDDFGPRAVHSLPPPPQLEAAGALCVLADGEPAGYVSWHWGKHWGPSEGSRCPMIGIWMRPEHRGRGVGSIAQARVAELFFTHTPVNRVEAHTDVANLAEQRALERAGFIREGVTRGAQWRGGAFRDGVLYAVLRDDPSPVTADPGGR